MGMLGLASSFLGGGMTSGMTSGQTAPDQVTITPTLTAGSGSFSVGGGSNMTVVALAAMGVLFLLMIRR
jgi:hypothetical protein